VDGGLRQVLADGEGHKGKLEANLYMSCFNNLSAEEVGVREQRSLVGTPQSHHRWDLDVLRFLNEPRRFSLHSCCLPSYEVELGGEEVDS
jgi:hypothetical protein